MGFFDKMKELNEKAKESKSKKIKIVAKLYHLEGIPKMKDGQKTMVELNPKDNKLYIEERLVGKHRNNATVLDMDKFKYVESTTVSEIQEKDKSIIGRAIVGGLVGPVGAVIGGLSGLGSKKKEINNNIMIIGYKSNEERKQISFMDGKGTMNYKFLYNELKKYEREEENKTGQTEL